MAIEELLLRAEARRTRTWSMIAIVLCAVCTPVALPAGIGDWEFLAFVLGCCALATAATVVYLRLRKLERFSGRLLLLFGFVCALVIGPFALFLGPFSPFPVVVSVGVLLFGSSRHARISWLVIVSAVGVYVVVALLATTGAVRFSSLVPSDGLSSEAKLFFVVAVPLVLLSAFALARRWHAVTDSALREAYHARQALRAKEAQVAELAADIDALRHPRMGDRGPASGLLLDGWTLGVLLGRGAMGDVYEACASSADAPSVAVKILNPALASSPEAVKRFLREQQIAAELESPNIARVLGAGRVDGLGPYLVMERLSGEDLGSVLLDRDRLPLAEVEDICVQTAAGLAVAHESGVIHRDIKPQNLFRHVGTDSHVWKVLDFGVALLRDADSSLTQGHLVGTPSYMSPELVAGEKLTPCSDLFALGAVLYRALTSRSAFAGRNVAKVLHEIAYKQPARPSALVPGLHADVDMALALVLAKKSSQRLQSAEEFSRAFRDAANGTLSRELRSRAGALVAQHPWGTSKR